MGLLALYSIRSLVVRWASALFTAFGIALTVAVFAGILALVSGFEQIYKPRGRGDLAIYLRVGATSEGESGFTRETASVLVKERPEIARNAEGQPMAAAESYLAVYMDKLEGGVTNVPLRGIQPMSLELYGESLRLVEGRWLSFGADEVVIGRPLTARMRGCRLGDTVMLNVTPFKVVGIYELDGVQGAEVWGDVDRMMDAMARPIYQRVIAKLSAGVNLENAAEELKSDARTPAQLRSERDYLAKQTGALSGGLRALAVLLAAIMGLAAVLGAINTMLAAVASRTHEVGVLLAIGFAPRSVFLAFLLESALLGIAGGILGVLLVLPLHGLETGAMNWNTFTDVSFAFQVTPSLMVTAVSLALILGVVGGTFPAWRASRLRPVEAIRQQ